MKATVQWNIGKAGIGFGVNAEAEIPEADVPVVLGLGLKYLLQRVSKVDDIFGGYALVDGKRVRRTGYKRSDVPFDTALTASLSEAFATLEFPDSTKETPHVLRGVQTTFALAEGKAGEPVYARERKKFAEKESTEEGLDGWLERFAGYVGPTHGDDGEYAPAALQAAKVAIDRFLKENV